ncbi:hypothetical protein FRC01_003174 [Tulasnella sp. 417]|nr:hypothetical protein FRC01_003174 [Tulasnella sp. 417]
MDQTADRPTQDFPVGDATITAKDQSADDFQAAGTHVDNPPRPQETTPSSELALNRKHNAALSIHTLPAEVFVQVIHLHMLDLLDSEGYTKGYNKHLINLSGVCLYWHNLIRDSPPLWTRLDLSDPPEVVEIVLQRSSSHPLDVILDPPAYQSEPEAAALANFQSISGPTNSCRDRWRSMVIDVSSPWVEAVFAGLREPAPNLEKLSFSDCDTIASSQEFDLFGGYAPRLTDLNLNGVSIRWQSEVLHNLTDLALSWIHFPSTDAILHALSHSPLLENLRIIMCTTQLQATPSSPSVRLPQLVSLDVHLGGYDPTENFLNHIITNVKNA